jgi:hypothetical protein
VEHPHVGPGRSREPCGEVKSGLARVELVDRKQQTIPHHYTSVVISNVLVQGMNML